MVRAMSPERVAAEVAALSDLPRERLAELWQERFGQPPPRGSGRQLLELSAAYAIQEKTFGGLKPATRRALASVADPHGADSEQLRPRRQTRRAGNRLMKPGTRLVREWNGRTYHVEVVAGGFVWNGKTRRSLSVIAREITGAQWSGPRFFGL
jgi:Protein of unknown function (DUF2924)